MQIPLQITFRQMPASAALEARIRELIGKLERFSPHVVSCQVVVEESHQHHQQGNLFEVRIDVTTPRGAFSIRRAHPYTHAHEDAYVALRDAYRALRRRLQDYERRSRAQVKASSELPRGHVRELDLQQGFGRIETGDGRLIYFHRNSVLDAPFESLTLGTEVRFAEESGTLGPQASTVHVHS